MSGLFKHLIISVVMGLAVCLLVFTLAVYRGSSNAWIIVLLGGGFGLSTFFITPHTDRIRRLLFNLVPLILFFIYSWIIFWEFYPYPNEDRSDIALVRGLTYIKNMDWFIIKSFYQKFSSIVSIKYLFCLYLGFGLVTFAIRFLKKEITLDHETQSTNDGSILNKRYDRKSNRFGRRF